MWHGQTCYISQIKTKRVGAWPLWIFSMVAQIFNVFKFIFAKSSRKKIFFCWGHTNTLGTFLRRSPLLSSVNWFVSPHGADDEDNKYENDNCGTVVTVIVGMMIKRDINQGGNRGTHAQACNRHNCLVTSPFALRTSPPQHPLSLQPPTQPPINTPPPT